MPIVDGRWKVEDPSEVRPDWTSPESEDMIFEIYDRRSKIADRRFQIIDRRSIIGDRRSSIADPRSQIGDSRLTFDPSMSYETGRVWVCVFVDVDSNSR